MDKYPKKKAKAVRPYGKKEPDTGTLIALAAVDKAGADLQEAQRLLSQSCRALRALCPFRIGDLIDHRRYGPCVVAAIEVRPHPEYGALWGVTACPNRKDGKPGARKVTWLERIIEPKATDEKNN